MTDSQPNPEQAGVFDDLTRSVVARTRGAQRALSPWVQRWLQTGGGPEAGGGARFYTPLSMALTAAHTARLLGRVGRTVAQTTVRRAADVGPLEPATADRFAAAIVDRFPAVEAKFEPQALGIASAEGADLILAGRPVQPSSEAETPPSEPVAPRKDDDFFAGMPSLAELEAKLEPHLRRTPPRTEQAATERPRARQPVRTQPPGARIVSRVEEMPSRDEIPPAVEAPQARPEKVEPAREERAPGQAWVAEVAPPGQPVPGGPARPPPVQRQPVEEMPPSPETPAPPPAAEEPPGPSIDKVIPGLPEAEPEPSVPQRPPVGVEVTPARPEAPPVQRRLDEGIPPAPAEAEPVSPPVSVEVTPARPEAPPAQRRLDEEIPPGLEAPRPAPAEAESVSPPVGVEVTPARPEAPPAQRQPAEEVLPSPEVSAPPSIEEEPASPPVSREIPPLRPKAPPVRQPAEEVLPSPEAPAPPPAETEPHGLLIGPEVTPTRPEALRAQRQPDQEALPGPEMLVPPPVEAEAVSPPVSREVTPRRPETPLVQRKVEVDESVAGLEEEVLARATLARHLPLSEPLEAVGRFEPKPDRTSPAAPSAEPEPSRATYGDFIRTRPLVQTAILPQARLQTRVEDEPLEKWDIEPPAVDRVMPLPESAWQRLEPARAVPGWPRAEEGELPLPPLSRPASADLVQRQPVDVSGELPQEEQPELDLNDLARQIYPLIKRMLGVERERRWAR